LLIGRYKDEKLAAFPEERVTAEDGDLGAGITFEDFEDLEAEVIHWGSVGSAAAQARRRGWWGWNGSDLENAGAEDEGSRVVDNIDGWCGKTPGVGGEGGGEDQGER
jgi:hypothetical protein